MKHQIQIIETMSYMKKKGAGIPSEYLKDNKTRRISSTEAKISCGQDQTLFNLFILEGGHLPFFLNLVS